MPLATAPPYATNEAPIPACRSIATQRSDTVRFRQNVQASSVAERLHLYEGDHATNQSHFGSHLGREPARHANHFVSPSLRMRRHPTLGRDVAGQRWAPCLLPERDAPAHAPWSAGQCGLQNDRFAQQPPVRLPEKTLRSAHVEARRATTYVHRLPRQVGSAWRETYVEVWRIYVQMWMAPSSPALASMVGACRGPSGLSPRSCGGAQATQLISLIPCASSTTADRVTFGRIGFSAFSPTENTQILPSAPAAASLPNRCAALSGSPIAQLSE